MVCRAIRLAALSAVFALVAWAGVLAQNLDAGKTPAQLFTGTCAACHATPRGLLKSVSPGQLSGFLRQHYTTGSEMAGTLAGYLIQSGAGVRVETPAKKAAPKAARKAPETPAAPGATADAPAAPQPGKGKARQPPATIVEGAPTDGQPPGAKRQAADKKKGDKRAPPPAAATPEPAPEPAQVAAPEVKPEVKPEPPTPLPVQSEYQPDAPAPPG